LFLSNSWVCLNDSSGTTIDLVSWGSNAYKYEGTPFTPNPPEGKSLQRKVNATINESASYGPAWDSNDNSADFFVQDSPNPQNSTWITEHKPLPPVPELPSIVLLSIGLLTLATYIIMKKRKRKKK
jgi:hypothetical protein